MSQVTNMIEESRPWGYTAVFDFRNCDVERLKHQELLREIISQLPEQIGMTAYGEPRLEQFGDEFGPEWGWTGVQLLTTSHIAFHAAPNVGQFFLDITSCRNFNPDLVNMFIGGRLGGVCVGSRKRERGWVSAEDAEEASF